MIYNIIILALILSTLMVFQKYRESSEDLLSSYKDLLESYKKQDMLKDRFIRSNKSGMRQALILILHYYVDKGDPIKAGEIEGLIFQLDEHDEALEKLRKEREELLKS